MSREQPLIFFCLGRMLGGREDWGKTGSIRGCLDSRGSGDL